MKSSGKRILYIDTYTLNNAVGGRVPSSMSIGYGITASSVIRRSLRSHGYHLIRPLAETKPYLDGSRAARLRWVLRGYEKIADAVTRDRPDLIFLFHSFNAFPVEIRRILLELEFSIPMIGYSHGSHWDPTDTTRLERYPGLDYLDLANLTTMDRIFFDSHFMRNIVIKSIGRHNLDVANTIEHRSAVVGLPLDLELIDGFRSHERFSRTTVVFNHAPVTAKNPTEFVAVIGRLMPHFDINVLFTRGFEGDVPGAAEVRTLRERFGSRVILGGDMAIGDYFRALWMSDIQVSTAHHESFGVATLEAMYTENCCLLPNRGSYPEISGNNEDVLYDSVGELEERLATLVATPDKMRSIGRVLAGRSRKYGASTILPSIVRAIEETLSPPSTGSTDRFLPQRFEQ